MSNIRPNWTPADIASKDAAMWPQDTNRTGELIRLLAWAANEYAYIRRTGLKPDPHTAVALEQVEAAVKDARQRYPGNPKPAYLGRI